MDVSPSIDPALPVPNHHADHAGFSGVSGLAAALRFLSGRDRAAQLAIELAGLSAGERVADIGCGPGVAAVLARRAGAEVVAIDPASVMLRVARLRWWRVDGVAWRIGTAEALPLDDDSVDVIWSLATVHHWRDLDVGLREVVRALRPGGRLVAIERQIADTNAEGVASHGWVPEQAESFAAICRSIGFAEATVAVHPGEPTLLSVTARLA